MITIHLPPTLEDRLSRLASAQGRETSDLARQVLEEYLDLQPWTQDLEEAWGEASVAIASEVMGDDSWDERESSDGSC